MKSQIIKFGLDVTAILLAVGVFLPLTRLAFVGEVSYHDVAATEAYMLVALAVAGVALSVAKPLLTALAPAGCWLVLLFPTIQNAMKSDDGGLFAQLREGAEGIMNDFAADLLPDLISNIAEFHWGGFVLLLGLLGFTVFGVMRSIVR